ncbi:MAG: outer membrane beta-barrel family protein, partial [Bacteroidota bacterium]
SRQLDEQSLLKVGLRAEQTHLYKTDLLDGSIIEQRYLNWFPSFFLSREITEQTTLSLSYSKRLRRPSFNQLNDNIFKLNDFRFNLGNPNLTPEFRHRFELAANVRKHQFALFYNRVADAINGIYFLEGDVAFYQKFNSGSQTEYGLEYNRAADVTPWWFLRAVGRLFSRQFITDEGETTFQQTTVRLRLTNNFKLGERTRLEVRGTWYSPQSDAFFIREPLRELDAMLQRQLLNKKLVIRFHVRDLLGTLRFANRRPFETFATTSEVWPITRTYNLRLAYTFTSKQEVSTRKNRSRNEAGRRL